METHYARNRAIFLERVRRATLASLMAFGLFCSQIAAADTLRLTIPEYSPGTKTYFEKMAREFEQQNPGTKVAIEIVNWDNLLQKLQTDLSGSANADIAVVGTRWLLDFVRDGTVEPLNSYMDSAFRERFIEAFLQPGTLEGKVYGLPIAASARALYYNKDLLGNAGFPNGPKSWEDVYQASKKLKATGVAGFGLQGKEVETDIYWYYALWTYGGEIVDAAGKPAFNSPAGVKALGYYKKLINEGLTEPGVTSYAREDLQNLFKQGRLGMMITAPFLAKQIAKEAPKLRYGVVPVPTATTPATYAVTDSIVMFSNSKMKPMAWKMLNFLFSKEPRVAFSSSEGFLPTTKAEANDAAFSDPITKQFVSLLPTARFAPMIRGWEDMAKAVTNSLQSVYLGKAEPKAALDDAARVSATSTGK